VEEVTLNIDSEQMEQFKEHAKLENMDVQDFILEAATRYLAQNAYITADELADMLVDENLLD